MLDPRDPFVVTQSPHDRLFKRMLSDPRHAAGVLRAILPDALAARIAWSTLELLPGSYVDDRAKERHTDLLFRAKVAGTPTILVLLLEHQSRPDASMPLRLFHYMSHIWTHLKVQAEAEGKRLTKIPLILPMVLHQGASGWRAPTRLSELYDADPALIEAARPHIPDFELLLEDLVELSEEEIDAREATEQAKLTLWALGLTIRDPDPERLPLRAKQLGRLIESEGTDAVRSLIDYLSNGSRGEPVVDALLAAGQSRAIEEVTMGLRQEWEAAAKAQGELEGQARLLLKLLRLRFGEPSDEAVSRVRAASREELDRWAERILTAASIDELWSE